MRFRQIADAHGLTPDDPVGLAFLRAADRMEDAVLRRDEAEALLINREMMDAITDHLTPSP